MLEFSLIILVFVSSLLGYAIFKNGFKWLKTRDGKGILAGLFLAPIAAFLILTAVTFLLGGCSTYKDPYVEVYAGLERTKKLSPQCDVGGADDRLTSNLGVNICGSVSKDKNTQFCYVYRHHSCAITADRFSYDAFGVYVSRKVYIKW